MILVDSNVLLDLIKDDPVWGQWSLARLDEAALTGPLLINSLIYAELSVGYPSIGALEKFVEGTGFGWLKSPKKRCFWLEKLLSVIDALAVAERRYCPTSSLALTPQLLESLCLPATSVDTGPISRMSAW